MEAMERGSRERVASNPVRHYCCTDCERRQGAGEYACPFSVEFSVTRMYPLHARRTTEGKRFTEDGWSPRCKRLLSNNSGNIPKTAGLATDRSNQHSAKSPWIDEPLAWRSPPAEATSSQNRRATFDGAADALPRKGHFSGCPGIRMSR